MFKTARHALEIQWRRGRLLGQQGELQVSFTPDQILLTQKEVKGGAPSQ